MNWSHCLHGADIGLRWTGATKAQASEQIWVALTAVIPEPERVDTRDRLEILCAAPDDDMLLLDWLNSLIYEIAVCRMPFREFDGASATRWARWAAVITTWKFSTSAT